MGGPATWHRDGCHQSTVLEVLEQFRIDGRLCDVTLETDGRSIRAHRLVLAASSPYFQAMFMGSMRESQQSTIVIKGIDPQALDAMVTYAYTASIKLDQENVESLLACADLLQVTSVYNACCQYLASHLSPGNCLGVWRLAGLYSGHDLGQQAFKFAQDHFREVSEEAEFRLLSAEDLEKLVACEELAVSCEEQVFKAVLHWAKFDPPQRASKLSSLLKYVAVPLLSPDYLLDQIETEPILSQGDPALSHLRGLQVVCEDDSPVRTRGHRKKVTGLLAVGGECEGCSLSSSFVFSEGSREWSASPCRAAGQCGRPDEAQVAPMKLGRSAFGIACDGKQVYVAGGLSTSADPLDSVECYNVADNRWSQVAVMKERRHGCQACFLNNDVYVLGGHSGRGYSPTVERLHPATGASEYVAPLPHAKAFMGLVVLAGRIYVIGGTGSDGTNVYYDAVHCYDPMSDRWSTVMPMNERRAYVGAAVAGGCIYAIGGFNGKWLKTVERYDPRENRWTPVAPMRHERSSFGLGVMDGCVYVAGGFDGRRCLSTVAKYDPVADGWTAVAGMPSSRYGVRLASLRW